MMQQDSKEMLFIVLCCVFFEIRHKRTSPNFRLNHNFICHQTIDSLFDLGDTCFFFESYLIEHDRQWP